MPSRSNFPILLPFLLLTLLPGCTSRWATTPCITPAPLVEERLFKNQRMEKISAMAEIIVTSDSIPHKMRAVMIFQGPQRLRMEILSLLGTPEMMLSIVEGKARLYLPHRQEFYRDITHLSPLLDLPLEAGDLSALIYGALPPPLRKGICFMPPVKEGGLYRYDLISAHGNRKTQVWLTGDEEEIKKVLIFSGEGQLEITATYGEYVKTRSLSFPRQVNITAPSMAISFSFSDLECIEDQEPIELPVPSETTSSRGVSIGQCSPDSCSDNP